MPCGRRAKTHAPDGRQWQALGRMKRFDKRDVALEMLDAAVSEHLDHARHFAAYNLAAVAEELLSKLLKCSRKADSSDLKIGAAKAMSRALGQPEGEDNAWRKLFFKLKNTIKHMDGASDRLFDANIEVSARQKIGDAVSNLNKLGFDKSPQVLRFDEHRLSRHRQNAL
jgi:hypothetical protein